MAINFPTSPTNGQTYSENGSSWEYSDDEGGVWLTVPQTVTGPAGPAGPSGNIQIGTTSTGDPGTSVILTNSGNGSYAVLNFTVPRGNTGAGAPLSISLEYPTSAEKVPILFTTTALTVLQIRSVLQGTATPSVTFSVRHGPILSDSGNEVVTSGITVTNTTYGLSTTSFNDATIDANTWIWLTTSAVSGTVNTLSVVIVT